MRPSLTRMIPAIVALSLAPVTDARAHGHGRYTETVYESVVATPTTYVVPSSYVTSGYALPTVYPIYEYIYPTSAYVAPSVVTTTRTVSPRRYSAARPIVTSTRRYSYIPTAATLVPTSTVYDLPVVLTSATSSTVGCVEAPPIVYPAIPKNGGSSAATTNRGTAGSGRPSSEIASEATDEPGLTNRATASPPPTTGTPGGSSQGGGTPANANPSEGTAGAGSQSDALMIPPAPAPEATDGTQEGTSTNPATNPSETTQRRDVRRPVLGGRGVLQGRVVSNDTGQFETGVKVIARPHGTNFDPRIRTTDDLGRFAINLPEGDWTVEVELPSGKRLAVSDITVSGGRVTTVDGGRDIPSLIIKR